MLKEVHCFGSQSGLENLLMLHKISKPTCVIAQTLGFFKMFLLSSTQQRKIKTVKTITNEIDSASATLYKDVFVDFFSTFTGSADVLW